MCLVSDRIVVLLHFEHPSTSKRLSYIELDSWELFSHTSFLEVFNLSLDHWNLLIILNSLSFCPCVVQTVCMLGMLGRISNHATFSCFGLELVLFLAQFHGANTSKFHQMFVDIWHFPVGLLISLFIANNASESGMHTLSP